MPSQLSLLITTTDSVENRAIERYLGPIATHVVAGTGFFSDLLAGLSDIFGGKSGSYERQLEALHRDVVAALRKRALGLGANAVVGLRLDFDEISGKNMQMFMVTATGTAVRLEPDQSPVQPDSSPLAVAGEDLEVAMFRASVVRRIETGDYSPNVEQLRFATLYGIVELALPVATRIADIFSKKKDTEGFTALQEQFLAECPQYFGALPADVATQSLYELVALGGKAREFSLKLIAELYLTNYERIRELLGNADFKVRARSIELLRGHPGSYTRDDLAEMELTLELLVAGPLARAERVSEKKAFRSEVAIFWLCQCGTKVGERDSKCYVCHRDEFGFKQTDLNLARAIDLVRRRTEALRGMFSGADSLTRIP